MNELDLTGSVRVVKRVQFIEIQKMIILFNNFHLAIFSLINVR